MTIKEAIKNTTKKITAIYAEGEANSIAHLAMENITGTSISKRIIAGNITLSKSQIDLLNEMTDRLLQNEPIQYIINESWFCGFKFYVDENVLIPRSETEELTEWLISNSKLTDGGLKIIDIGTGSGCIAITLKKRIPGAEVWACDISEKVLEISKKNAINNSAEINFIKLNILDNETWKQFPGFNIIISNPPYVPEKDKMKMQANVLKYEPSTALFVPDNDPLVFYKAIAGFGKQHLSNKGNIYLEINEELGEITSTLFRENGYSCELKSDMQGKNRMIKASIN